MPEITIDQALQLAVGHHQAGRLADAEAMYRRILAAQPNHAEALNLLGVIAGQVGRHETAVKLIQQAIAVAPGKAEYRCNLGLFLKSLGQIDAAVTSYQWAIHLRPDYPEAYFNLGIALRDKGQINEAIASYQKVVELRPEFAEARNNLGDAMGATGQIDRAMEEYQRAISLKPDYCEAHYNLANAWKEKGQLERAMAEYQRAVEIKPEFAQAHNNLGIALGDAGRIDDAIEAYQRAAALRPDYAEAHYNLGNAWKALGQPDRAVASYGQAVALKPDYIEAHNNLGNTLREQGRIDEALASYHRAMELRPDLPIGHNNVGIALADKGELDGALAAYRRALDLKADYVNAHSNLIYLLNFHPDYGAEAIRAEHLRWNRQHAEPLKKLVRPHLNDRNSGRRLRVGYVSPDLRDHPVGRFMMPLLASRDRGDFHVTCYADVPRADEITEKLRAQADAWRNITGQSDEPVAEMIRQDQIDILVDLAMHTSNNRLLVLARRPAPVQVTYLAYAGGTALEAIDYRLTDRYLDPDEANDAQYMEKSIRLEGTYWCYQQVFSTPPVNELPALATGTITLACLNNFSKIAPAALETWAEILRGIPNARLLLHAPFGSHRERIMRFMEERGIGQDRLELIGRVLPKAYFEIYQRVDIGLDSFPCAGATTTCDALWMGAPVVTLAGERAVGRAGVSILSNAGMPELIASTKKDYVRIVCDLAGDLTRLAELRGNLRERLRKSTLMDGGRFARDVEKAYRRMWTTWCENS